jgi:transposase
MQSVPLDLRQRIVSAYERKEGTYFEVAQRFGVGEATVYRLLRLKREQGAVLPPTRVGIPDDELPQLALLVSEFPHATLDQLRISWVARYQRELSRSSMVRALRRAGIARKRAAGRPRKAPRKAISQLGSSESESADR